MSESPADRSSTTPPANKKGKGRQLTHKEIESDDDINDDMEYKEDEESKAEDDDNEDNGIENEEDSDNEPASDHAASTSADHRNKVKHPSKAPSSRSHMTKTSITPQPTSTDPYKDWDNGEALTPIEHAKIMLLKSNYERAQAMNKRRNARMLKELELKQGVADLFGDLNATKPKKSIKVTSKPTSTLKATKRYVH
jgi:hypothetical protein